jgi:hypothetical protein
MNALINDFKKFAKNRYVTLCSHHLVFLLPPPATLGLFNGTGAVQVI